MKIENEKIVLMDLNENLKSLMSVPNYEIGSYKFDAGERLLMDKNESVKLTRKESYLLVSFAASAGNLLERKHLLTTIWKDDNYSNSRSMDVYICKLRKLLAKDPSIMIINIHGKGYKMIISK